MKGKAQKTGLSAFPKSGSIISFALGFLCAAILGYLLLYNHFIQIATSTDAVYSKGTSLGKTSLRAEDKVEIQQLLQTVDELYEKMKHANIQHNSKSTPSISWHKTETKGKTSSEIKATLLQQPTSTSATPTKNIVMDAITLQPGLEESEEYKGLNLTPLRQHISAAHSKNVVFALAANIDPKYFAIFIKSFRKYNSDASMFVFVNTPVDEKVLSLAQEMDIMLLDYTVDQLQPEFLRKYHPSSLRWILYDRILRLPLENKASADENTPKLFGSLVEKIIALDARDSAFQRDPFTLFSATDDSLLVFGEDRHSIIGQCGWNSAWVKDCFPRSVYDEVSSQPIICSGISMGASSAMLRYVQRMANILGGTEIQLVNAAEHFPHCERNGVDQGIHNVLVHALHRGLKVKILYPEDFPVVNMQSGKDSTMISQVEEGGKIARRVFMTRRTGSSGVNHGREAFAIVHQFDRDNDLQASLAREYIDWIKWGDTQSEWETTKACAKMSYVDQGDLFKAMCDIGAARAISAATCCEACDRKFVESGKKCTGFTYYGGVCYLKNCDQDTINQRKELWSNGGHGERMKLSGALTGYITPLQ